MIVPVHPRISVGGEPDCMPGQNLDGRKATIHACKFPCWSRFANSKQLPKDHPLYLMCVYPYDLALNIIDPVQPLFQRETFIAAREFASQHLRRGTPLFIHCNKGESRAPAIAMLILAKDLGEIEGESYDAAKHRFSTIYPAFKPGAGIETFMREHWSEL